MAPQRTEIPVRAPQTTIEIKTENPNGIEQPSLMSRFTFFKQIFKLIAILTDRTWNRLQIFLALASVWSRYVMVSYQDVVND